MTLNGAPVIITTLDTLTIVSPRARGPIVLKITIGIVTRIAKHAIVFALALVAVLVIAMITEIAITSQMLVIPKAKTTMPNTETDPDQKSRS